MDKLHWLEMRKNKIGASDAPVIMNMSPWKTPYSLWQEKVGMNITQHTNSAMRRGLELEGEALDAFESITGHIMFPQMVVNHPTISWMMATMDGISLDKSVGVEVKCAGKVDHELAKNRVIPDKYIPQLQHQMEVCGWDEMFYFSYHNKEGVVVEVKRDRNFNTRMLEQEEEFWNCVTEFRPPSKTEKDIPKQYCVRDDDLWVSTCQDLLKIRRQMKELENRDKELLQELKIMSKGSEVSGGGIVLCKRSRVGNVDYKKIPELQGVDIDAYRKPASEYWTIEEHD